MHGIGPLVRGNKNEKRGVVDAKWSQSHAPDFRTDYSRKNGTSDRDFYRSAQNSSLSSSFLHVVKKTSEVSGGIARNADIAFWGRGRQRKAKAK
jgi:hypothetical protein